MTAPMTDAIRALATSLAQLLLLGAGIGLGFILICMALEGIQSKRKDKAAFDVDSELLKRFRVENGGIARKRLGQSLKS